MEETKLKEHSQNLLNVMAVNMADLPASLEHLMWLRKEFRARLDEIETDYKINSTLYNIAVASVEGAIDMVADEMDD